MVIQALLGELQHEAENTRNLVKSIPNELLNYKPTEFYRTIGEQASHISEIYSWWPSTLSNNELNLENYVYDREDISSIESIEKRLNENIELSVNALQNFEEPKLMELWTMKSHGHEIIPPMPKVQVIRGFLLNHVYHHRGQIIAFLRVNNCQVPGLYGMTYEQMAAANTM